MNTNDLARRARNKMLAAYYNDGRPAVSGLADGTFYFTDEGGNTHYSRIWVRYSDQAAPHNIGAPYNGNVPLQVGIPVTVKNINGALIAYVTEHGLARIQYNTGNNGMMPVAPHSHHRLGPNPDYVEGLRFLPTVVRPSDPPALTVYVEAGWYLYQGGRQVWRGGDSGSLSSYVPVSDDGSIAYVAVCLNASTNTIAIVDGGVVTDGGPLFPAEVTWDEVEAIVIPSHYLPLGIVQLSYGQTTVLPSHITFDLRPFGGMTTGGANLDSFVIDANGNPVADANGNLLAGIA